MLFRFDISQPGRFGRLNIVLSGLMLFPLALFVAIAAAAIIFMTLTGQSCNRNVSPVCVPSFAATLVLFGVFYTIGLPLSVAAIVTGLISLATDRPRSKLVGIFTAVDALIIMFFAYLLLPKS